MTLTSDMFLMAMPCRPIMMPAAGAGISKRTVRFWSPPEEEDDEMELFMDMAFPPSSSYTDGGFSRAFMMLVGSLVRWFVGSLGGSSVGVLCGVVVAGVGMGHWAVCVCRAVGEWVSG